MTSTWTDRIRGADTPTHYDFQTVAEMVASELLAAGAFYRTLGYHVAGDGGGNTYEIVAAGTGTADGGSYIDLTGTPTLQAKGFMVSEVDVRLFGAKGDGTTDDTAALQAAIDYGNDLFFPPGDYSCQGALNFNNGAQNIRGADKWKARLDDDTGADAVFLNVNRSSVRFNNIGIKGPGPTGKTEAHMGIRVARPSGQEADLDFEMIDCYLSGFYYGGEQVGRGVTIRDCVLSLCRYGWNLEWPDDGTYIVEDDWHSKKSTGFRRLVFDGNEFHAMAVAFVRNRGANASNAEIMIVNNHTNLGDGLFQGELGAGSLVQGNMCGKLTGPAMVIDGGEDYFVGPNIFHGTFKETEDGSSTHILEISGTNLRPKFQGLSLGYCQEHGVRVEGTMTAGVFSDITMTEVAKLGSPQFPMRFIGSTHTVEVRDVVLSGTTTPSAIVRVDAGSVVNVTNATQFGRDVQMVDGGDGFSTVFVGGNGISNRLITVGSGSPEGVVNAFRGSLYMDADGSAGATLYVKETLSGNTGWVAK